MTDDDDEPDDEPADLPVGHHGTLLLRPIREHEPGAAEIKFCNGRAYVETPLAELIGAPGREFLFNWWWLPNGGSGTYRQTSNPQAKPESREAAKQRAERDQPELTEFTFSESDSRFTFDATARKRFVQMGRRFLRIEPRQSDDTALFHPVEALGPDTFEVQGLDTDSPYVVAAGFDLAVEEDLAVWDEEERAYLWEYVAT